MFVDKSMVSGKGRYFCAVNMSFNAHDASCRIMSELSLKAQFVNLFWEASLNSATEAPESSFCRLVLEQFPKGSETENKGLCWHNVHWDIVNRNTTVMQERGKGVSFLFAFTHGNSLETFLGCARHDPNER